MGEPVKQLRRAIHQFTVIIVATVLCGVLATVASVVYTSWANDQQDAKMCRFLNVLDANAPSPAPSPTDPGARARVEAYKQFRRDIHCK